MGKLTFQAALGGTVDLVGPNTASAVTLNLPATSGDIVGTGSTGVVTTSMISGQVAVAQGGTGASTAQVAINTLAGAVTSGSYLRGNGTNVTMSAIQAADVPTLNQNTTGTAANITASSNSSLTTLSALSLPGSQVSGNISGNAANVTGIVAVANGGTGTATPALVAGTNVTITGTWPNQTINSSGGGSGMVYPGAGIPLSTGSAWGTSYSTSGSGNVALTVGASLTTPSISGPKIDYVQASTSTGSTNVLSFTNNAGTASGPYLNVGNATPASNNPIVLSIANAGIYAPNLELQAASNGYVAINNGATPSKQILLDASGTSGTYTRIVSSQTTTRVLTLPDATDTLVGKATSDVLTNKVISGANNSFIAIPMASLTGTLDTGYGGTGQTSYTNGQLLIGNSTGNTLAKSTLTAGTGISITNGAGSITIAATGGTGTVTSVAATVPSFLSVTGSPVTTSGTLAISYSGTALPVANGGTGVTVSSGANSVVLRDANQNISINSISEGYVNVAAAGTTTVLTVASAPNYVVTGSGGQTYQLPDATTLANGVNYVFNNNQSSGTIVVKNNSSTTIATIQSGGYVEVVLLSNSIAAGSWDVHNQAPSNVSWSTNTFSYPGTLTSATWNGNAIGIGYGGTGQTTASAAFNALSPITTTGDLILGNGTNSATRLAIGTNGYVLTSNGTTASWAAASSGSGTVTSITAGTGLTGGTITTSGTIALATTAVTAASYTSANITVDAYGRITAAANGSGGSGITAGKSIALSMIFGY